MSVAVDKAVDRVGGGPPHIVDHTEYMHWQTPPLMDHTEHMQNDMAHLACVFAVCSALCIRAKTKGGVGNRTRYMQWNRQELYH